MSLLWLLIILLIVALLFGGWGAPRWGYGGYVGWSPALLVLLILVVLFFLAPATLGV